MSLYLWLSMFFVMVYIDNMSLSVPRCVCVRVYECVCVCLQESEREREREECNVGLRHDLELDRDTC